MATINIVISYSSKDKSADATLVYLGYDFAAAKEALTETSDSSPRRELYRGGMPYLYRSHKSTGPVSAPAAPVKAKVKPVIPLLSDPAPEQEPAPPLSLDS